jgi:hypothetical protein
MDRMHNLLGSLGTPIRKIWTLLDHLIGAGEEHKRDEFAPPHPPSSEFTAAGFQDTHANVNRLLRCKDLSKSSCGIEVSGQISVNNIGVAPA